MMIGDVEMTEVPLQIALGTQPYRYAVLKPSNDDEATAPRALTNKERIRLNQYKVLMAVSKYWTMDDVKLKSVASLIANSKILNDDAANDITNKMLFTGGPTAPAPESDKV
jgi:hypothetical protein